VTNSLADSLPERLAADLDGAFPALVRAYVDGIYSGVRRLVPTAADAEDVTQETLVRAYRALAGYDPARIAELRVRAWLWTIALNLCRNAARRRSRRVAEVSLVEGDGAAAPDDVAADAIGTLTEVEWSRRLARLPAPLRTAVVLRHVADLPYAEIAAATDRPVGTVKADVHRALDRLRRMLEEEASP
jgi:RNA polymerase sigma-70 factor (ECF subfamily)